MMTIVLLENSARRATMQRMASELGSGQDRELIIIGSSANASLAPEGNFISSAAASMGECISKALTLAKGTTTIFLDARSDATKNEVEKLISESQNLHGTTISYAPIRVGDELVEAPDLSHDSLVTSACGAPYWPTSFIAITTEFARGLSLEDAQTSTESLVRLMIRAASLHESIVRLNTEIDMSMRTEPFTPSQMSAAETSRCLQTVINENNIEELFPNRPWETDEAESGAACYHSLAARFIKLGDFTSAMDCLTLSDRLDDSPRSLALKGLISLMKGETLGAVANMVSSLQQYELKKKEMSKTFYQKPSPKSLELINSKLHAGLEALNKRDNESALEHFTEAVFNFDSFYQEVGVDRLDH